MKDTVFYELGHEIVRGLVGTPGKILNLTNRYDRELVQKVKYAMAIAGGTAAALGNNLAMPFAQEENLSRSLRCLLTDFENSLQEEAHPSLPVSFITNRLQAIIVFLPMLLEEMREIQYGLLQYVTLTEKQCNQQPSDTAVPVQERMNGLKLGVGKTDTNKQRYRLFRMKKVLEITQQSGKFM